MTEKYTFEEWVEKYFPLALVDGDGEPYMFETYGDDMEFVDGVSSMNVWTLIEDEDEEVVLSGMHLVNRIGYYITIIPWETKYLIVDWD